MNVWKSLGPSVGGCWEFLDHLLAVILKLLLAKIQKKKTTRKQKPNQQQKLFGVEHAP